MGPSTRKPPSASACTSSSSAAGPITDVSTFGNDDLPAELARVLPTLHPRGSGNTWWKDRRVAAGGRMGEAGPATMERRRFRVSGVVQGVGFRPFVYGLAHRHGLAGFVLNDGGGLVIEAEGETLRLEAFAAALLEEAPPLARIDGVSVEPLCAAGELGFTIAPSLATAATAVVPPDVATCEECLRELFDPGDRRYRYPFVNCTRCGPRFTIVRAVPYDRANTTMAGFPMCGDCRREYEDPADRRFHAE